MNKEKTSLSSARYFTADEVATILGIERKDVYALRRQGIAEPVLTRGLEQYDRAGLAKMAAYVLLRDMVGDRTDRPAVIVQEQRQEMERALDSLDREDPLVLRLQGRRSTTRLAIPLVSWLRTRIAQVPASVFFTSRWSRPCPR
jgi:chemotaxis regulatin CheY-phosphate phosphatase CheZ